MPLSKSQKRRIVFLRDGNSLFNVGTGLVPFAEDRGSASVVADVVDDVLTSAVVVSLEVNVLMVTSFVVADFTGSDASVVVTVEAFSEVEVNVVAGLGMRVVSGTVGVIVVEVKFSLPPHVASHSPQDP